MSTYNDDEDSAQLDNNPSDNTRSILQGMTTTKKNGGHVIRFENNSQFGIGMYPVYKNGKESSSWDTRGRLNRAERIAAARGQLDNGSSFYNQKTSSSPCALDMRSRSPDTTAAKPLPIPPSPITPNYRRNQRKIATGKLDHSRLSEATRQKLLEIEEDGGDGKWKVNGESKSAAKSPDSSPAVVIDNSYATAESKSAPRSRSPSPKAASPKAASGSTKAAKKPSKSPAAPTSSDKSRSRKHKSPSPTSEKRLEPHSVSSPSQATLTTAVFGDSMRIMEVSDAVQNMCTKHGLKILTKTTTEIPK